MAEASTSHIFDQHYLETHFQIQFVALNSSAELEADQDIVIVSNNNLHHLNLLSQHLIMLYHTYNDPTEFKEHSLTIEPNPLEGELYPVHHLCLDKRHSFARMFVNLRQPVASFIQIQLSYSQSSILWALETVQQYMEHYRELIPATFTPWTDNQQQLPVAQNSPFSSQSSVSDTSSECSLTFSDLSDSSVHTDDTELYMSDQWDRDPWI